MKRMICGLLSISVLFISCQTANADQTDELIPSSHEDFTTKSASIDMIKVEGGSFRTGLTKEELETTFPQFITNQHQDFWIDMFIPHQVTLSTYFVSKYEITQKQYFDVMNVNPTREDRFGDLFPVSQVSWFDAIDFCNALSVLESKTPCYSIDKSQSEEDQTKWVIILNINASGYRLPTDVEWEYAAGGGNKSMSYFYSGSNDYTEVAIFNENYIGPEGQEPRPSTVGSKKANEIGIFDMSGNLMEWIWDSPYLYSSESVKDPVGSDGVYHSRQVRGQCIYNPAQSYKMRISSNQPETKQNGTSFRIVCRIGS